jgi:hypothetical protein
MVINNAAMQRSVYSIYSTYECGPDNQRLINRNTLKHKLRVGNFSNLDVQEPRFVGDL